MSHPATLLKRYLTELNERIVKLDAKSDGGMLTVSDTISKLDQKLDGSVQTTNEALSRLDSKLDSGIRTVSDTISKLDQKLDGSVQTTNQAIGELYREKLSVQEFREFVNVFNKILGESFPLPEETVPQTSEPALQESHTKEDSGFQMQTAVNLEPESDAPQNTEMASPSQAVQEVTPQIIVESPSSDADEKTLKDIEIGENTTVEGTLVSGGKVTVNSNCVLKGSIESNGDIEIGENVIVKENLSSKSSIVLTKSAQVLRAINAAKDILRPRAGNRV